MRWHRLQDVVPAGLRSLLRRASARSSVTLRPERQGLEGDASLPISVHPDCPPGFRFEVTTQQIGVPDCPAISTVYQPPGSLAPPSNPEVGIMAGEATMPRRLLLMVHELHRRGYERLRVEPYLSSLSYWRCRIFPAGAIHGPLRAAPRGGEDMEAHYSESEGHHCFGWTDAAEDSPGELATKFLGRFAGPCQAGLGRDGLYARWYSEMLRATGPDGLIYESAEWEPPGDHLYTLGVPKEVRIPLPPPVAGGTEADRG